LKPGGELVFSTCTLSPEENESVIKFLLSNFPESRLCDLSTFLPGAPGLANFENENFGPEIASKVLRIWPHTFDSEGFFVAKIEKVAASGKTQVARLFKQENEKGAGRQFSACKFPKLKFPFSNARAFAKRKGKSKSPNAAFRKIPQKDLVLTERFFQAFNFPLRDLRDRIFQKESKVFLFPGDFAPRDFPLKFDRGGVCLGEILPGDFRPHFQAAVCLGQHFAGPQVLEISKQQAKLIFSGQDLPQESLLENDPATTFVLLRFGKIPLCWGKILQGKVKNLLPRNFCLEL